MLLLALAAGCAAAPELLVAPDAARDGLDGTDGPHGAAALARVYPARITDTVATTVVVPADADGAVLPGPWPVAVFVHGGLVPPARYQWIALHLATRGVVVALPSSPLDLAIMASGNASAALDGILADADGGPLDGAVDTAAPVLIGGHSLGGTVAALDWVADDRFGALLLGASYPAGGSDTASRADTPVLALVGSEDGSAPPSDVEAQLGDLDCVYGVVDGLNHYGWTDDATDKELANDGVASRPLEDARRDLFRVFDRWADAALAGDVATADAIATEAFANVTFPERE
jgi:dienelactone hydrolase